MQLVDKQYTHWSVIKQCKLLQVSRSGFYYQPAQESPENLAIMRVLNEQNVKTPLRFREVVGDIDGPELWDQSQTAATADEPQVYVPVCCHIP